jgi:hypothetical protein
VSVHDSGAPADGADRLVIHGTDAADTFLLRERFVVSLQYVDGVQQENYERVNYDASINVLEVKGWGGDDRFFVDDNSAITYLDGGEGADSFQFGQLFGSGAGHPAGGAGRRGCGGADHARLADPRRQLRDHRLRRRRQRQLPRVQQQGPAQALRRGRQRHLRGPGVRAARTRTRRSSTRSPPGRASSTAAAVTTASSTRSTRRSASTAARASTRW